MKNFLLIFVLISLFSIPILSNAQYGGMAPVPGLGVLGLNIAAVAWVVFTVIVIISFITSGILFLTSQGDPEKVKKARFALITGVVGVVVGILAYGAITMIRFSLGI